MYSGGSPVPRTPSSVQELKHDYCSPMTNAVIDAFQRGGGSFGVTRSPSYQPSVGAYRGLDSWRAPSTGSAAAPIAARQRSASPPVAYATERHITIGSFSARNSRSPSHEVRRETVTTVHDAEDPPPNTFSRRQVLAHHPVVGVTDELAPSRFVRRSHSREPPFPVVEEGVPSGGGARERSPVAYVPRKYLRSASRSPHGSHGGLSEEALIALQRRLAASRGGDDDAVEEDAFERVAVRPRTSHSRGGGSEPRQDERTDIVVPEHVRAQLTDIVQLLSNISNHVAPEIPTHVMHAYWRRVAHGSFFVKYPERGNPHQRFFRLRAIHNEIYGRQPYFEYATDPHAVTIKGRLHLAHFAGINQGVANSPTFSRFVVQAPEGERIRGPIYDEKRALLPTDFALTLVFCTPQQRQLISLVTLDEETFTAWVHVLQFLAAQNVHFNDLPREQQARQQVDTGVRAEAPTNDNAPLRLPPDDDTVIEPGSPEWVDEASVGDSSPRSSHAS